MCHCPLHVRDWIIDAGERFAELADSFHHYFQVVCRNCRGDRLRIFISNKCSVKVQCAGCEFEVVIYDLALYPAATKGRGEESFTPLLDTPLQPLRAFVGYEYAELDDDQVFDPNDITWFELYVETGGNIRKCFEDETA